MNTRPKDSDEQYDRSPKKAGETYCSGCGKTFDVKLKNCPHCQHYNEAYNPIGLKIIEGLIILAGVIVLAILAFAIYIGF